MTNVVELNPSHRADFLRLVNRAATRAEWCGSDDGVTWTPWQRMSSAVMTVPCCLLYQVRVLIKGAWHLSPIGTATGGASCPRCKLRRHQLVV